MRNYRPAPVSVTPFPSFDATPYVHIQYQGLFRSYLSWIAAQPHPRQDWTWLGGMKRREAGFSVRRTTVAAVSTSPTKSASLRNF